MRIVKFHIGGALKTVLVFVPKQLQIKVMPFENVFIGRACRAQYVTKKRLAKNTTVFIVYVDSAAGRPKPVGRPHYTWKDGAMQDLNALGPRLQLDLLRDWPKLALDRELWRGVASRC